MVKRKAGKAAPKAKPATKAAKKVTSPPKASAKKAPKPAAKTAKTAAKPVAKKVPKVPKPATKTAKAAGKPAAKKASKPARKVAAKARTTAKKAVAKRSKPAKRTQASSRRRARVVVRMAKEVDRKRAEAAARLAASMQQEEVELPTPKAAPSTSAVSVQMDHAKPTKPASPASSSSSNGVPQREIRAGFVSHTEMASADPVATKAWCEKVLGWKFSPPVQIPGGEYHLWVHSSNLGGGGIRANNAPEPPGTIPYVEVPDIHAAYKSAIAQGGKSVMAPDAVPGGGFIAIVAAPGSVCVGFWAPK